MRIIIFILGLALGSQSWAESKFPGQWRINLGETDKVSVKYEEGSGIQGGGRFTPTVSVMGLPMPKTYKQGPMSRLSSKDPHVLRCTNMVIQVEKKKVALVYDDSEKETLVKGDYRGRTAKWSRSKIEQSYKTTERSVRKTWTLRPDGRLEVAVKIKPRGDKARTYNRVFDRVTGPALDAAKDAAQEQSKSTPTVQQDVQS